LFAYLYSYFKGLDPLLAAIAASKFPALVFCRGIDPGSVKNTTRFDPFLGRSDVVSKLLPQADAVVCHASHQMTAQALLAGKPVLLLPTQLEQFLIMRRLVRFGAGLGIAPEVPNADYASALAALTEKTEYASKAREFSSAMLATSGARRSRL